MNSPFCARNKLFIALAMAPLSLFAIMPPKAASKKAKPAASVASPYDVIAKNIIGKPLSKDESPKGIYEAWNQQDSGLTLSTEFRKKVTDFSRTQLSNAFKATKSVYYPFGGPDASYPFVFFPQARTLVLVGTEKVGRLPTLEESQSPELQATTSAMLKDLFRASYFKTIKMQGDMLDERTATWTKIIAQLALFQYKILSTEAGSLDEKGAWVKRSAKTPRLATSPQGLRVICERPIGEFNTAPVKVSVYYFQQNLGKGTFTIQKDKLLNLPQSTPFMMFMNRFQKKYTSFLKAASYLSHDREEFELSTKIALAGDYIVQTDTGLPFVEFSSRKKDWDLTLFGDYLRPISDFPGIYENDLKNAYNGSYPDFVSLGGAMPFRYDYNGANYGSKYTVLMYGQKIKTAKAVPAK